MAIQGLTHRLVEPLDAAEPVDRAEALALVDTAMEAGSLSMEVVFPLLLGSGARSRRLIVRDEYGIVAHAAGRPATVRLAAGGALELVNVGCVATHERGRRRGYGSLLVTALLASAEARGADLAILWTSRPAFYERLGFVEAGCEAYYRVERAALDDVSPAEIRPAGAGDVEAMLALRRRDPTSLERTAAELGALLRIPRSHAFVVVRDGAPEGYLVVGKGLDYPGMVAEWAMPAARLAPALRAVFEESGARETLVFGPPRGEWIDVMERRGHARGDHSLAMFALLDRRRLCERAAIRDDPALDDHAFLIRLLGRPGVPSDPLIPLYVWGLDSN